MNESNPPTPEEIKRAIMSLKPRTNPIPPATWFTTEDKIRAFSGAYGIPVEQVRKLLNE